MLFFVFAQFLHVVGPVTIEPPAQEHLLTQHLAQADAAEPLTIREWGRLTGRMIQQRALQANLDEWRELLGGDTTVVIRFTATRDGRIEDVSIHQGSGVRVVDQAVVTTVESIEGLPAFTADMTDDRQNFVLPIRFVRPYEEPAPEPRR